MDDAQTVTPDSSFFRKIAWGPSGRALWPKGPLTKLWKDVKRKRVRIPDLVCLRCGMRVECRAKTKADVSQSNGRGAGMGLWHG